MSQNFCIAIAQLRISYANQGVMSPTEKELNLVPGDSLGLLELASPVNNMGTLLKRRGCIINLSYANVVYSGVYVEYNLPKKDLDI